MAKVYLLAASYLQDQQGSLEATNKLIALAKKEQLTLRYLTLETLADTWDTPIKDDHFRSGCGPLEALAQAANLIRFTEADLVVIQGEDKIKTGYLPEERAQLMQVYGANYPLTQAYTDLAKHFCYQQQLSFSDFKQLRNALFENYQTSAPQVKVDPRWFEDSTELFRGVDIANPYTDFSGCLVIGTKKLANKLASQEVTGQQPIQIAGIGLGLASGDGKPYLEELASYWHLKKAIYYANLEAGINFVNKFNQQQALLEAYTCYPVVPLGLLLEGRFVNSWQDIPAYLQQHQVTLSGGMNLNRAPWNLPALRGLIQMHQQLQTSPQKLGGVHGNGGLGYKQGFAILKRTDNWAANVLAPNKI